MSKREVISTYLLSALVPTIVHEVYYISGDLLYYSYNTKATVGNKSSISLGKLDFLAKNYIISLGYSFSIHTIPHKKGSVTKLTLYKDDTDEIVYSLSHKKEFKVVIAAAEIVFRLAFPFLPRRNDFLQPTIKNKKIKEYK